MSWQPIDTAPKDGSYLILYDGDCIFIGLYRHGEWYDLCAKCLRYFDSVTHWMPLPEPPK